MRFCLLLFLATALSASAQVPKVAAGTITIEWDAPDSGGTPEGYRWREGNDILGEPIALKWTIQGLAIGQHTLTITAFNAGGESPAVPFTFEVVSNAPGIPRNIRLPSAITQLTNLSTRAYVQTGDKVEIGGFIIEGNTEKRVIVRGIGPSLPLPGSLQHPQLELHDGSKVLATNAGWKQTQEQEITDSHLAPLNDSEAAIIAKLAPGSYTVILSDSKGQSGYGLVEVYSLDGI